MLDIRLRRISQAARIAVCGTVLLSAGTLHAGNLFFSDANGFLAGGPGFVGGFAWNNPSLSAHQTLNYPPAVQQNWTGSANLLTGELKSTATVSNNGSDGAHTTGYSSVITAFGDTVTYTGTASGGQNLTASLTISGGWSAAADGDATLVNESYLRVYFLKPGSFDHGLLAPGNVLGNAIWGIGPNAVVGSLLPNPVPYSGYISNFSSPTTVSFGFDIASLPSGFQYVVLLQTIMGGDTNGNGSFSWDIDFGHTIGVGLTAPDGVVLTTASSQVPEPASIGLAGLGALLIVVKKVRSRKS